MTVQSITTRRLIAWQLDCEAEGFDIDPDLTGEVVSNLPPGEVSFHAARKVMLDGVEHVVTLDVKEVWIPGDRPDGDTQLNQEGCYLSASNWHLQFGPDTGALGAERLDVVPEEDDEHPRIHRHPYGKGKNCRPARLDFPVPFAWLNEIDERMGGIFD